MSNYIYIHISLAGDRHCIRKYNVYLQLEIEIDIVSKNWTLSISFFPPKLFRHHCRYCRYHFCYKFPMAQIVQPEIFVRFISLFHMSFFIWLFLNYFLTIGILKKQKARCIYLAVKIIQLEISPARDVYLQLELDIFLQLYRQISLDRDRHLDCIQKFDFVDIIFVLNF